MSATPIDPKDIRPKDVVRVIDTVTVNVVTSDFSYLETDRDIYGFAPEFRTFELVSRPEPPREPGSLWLDPETRCVYVKLDRAAEKNDYAGSTIGSWRAELAAQPWLATEVPAEAAVIARLVLWQAKP